jgi:rubredoxin-NAD+ reductase
MEPIVIIGSGLGGYTVARELRKLDKETPLVIITADDGSFYSKPALSNALATGKTPQALALNDAAQMQNQLNATVRTHTRVQSIDAVAHTLRLDGETLRYSELVLALGADTVRPQLQGDAATEVISVNDLGDYARLRDALAGVRRIAIMGGGLIGCEFANDLATAGHEVSLVHLAPHPLDRLLPQAAGEAMREALQRIGVKWHLGTRAVGVERDGAGYRLTFADGSALQADVVLSAIGLAPRTELAAAAGIKIGRGIAVNRYLETSAEDIYALGDCAEVEGLVLPYVMPLMQAARALAKTLAGERTALSYPVMPVVVKTPAYPVVVAPPPMGTAGEWQVETAEDGLCALFYDAQQQLQGFALTDKQVVRKNALVQQLPAWLA